MSRYDSGFAAYVQAVCNCRRGYMCTFCRRWLTPGTPVNCDPRAVPPPMQE
jgi:hypothetical protein